jgi:hypothetical protein
LTCFFGRFIMEIAKGKTVPWAVDFSTTLCTADHLLALNGLPKFLFGPRQALMKHQRLSFFPKQSSQAFPQANEIKRETDKVKLHHLYPSLLTSICPF